MRKKRFYFSNCLLGLFLLFGTILATPSSGEDDDMEDDDDIYVDLQVDGNLLNRLLEILNTSTTKDAAASHESSSTTGSTSTATGPPPSVVLLNSRSSSSQQRQPVSLLKLPVILHSLNEKSRQLFYNFRLYFFAIVAILVVLILLTMILIVVNFAVSRRRHLSNSSGRLNRAKKKTTLSFDIIDNGYRQNRSHGQSGTGNIHVASGVGSSGLARFFHRSSSTQSNLVVDHDYHFEDFTNLNRTYDRINVLNNTTSLLTAVVCTSNEGNGGGSAQQNANSVTASSPDETNDNLYELPYIDASSTNDFNQQPAPLPSQQSSSSASTAGLDTVAVAGKSTYKASCVLAPHESLKFKTFSARKFNQACAESKQSCQLVTLSNNPD